MLTVALLVAGIAFLPLDDRPVTAQLASMLGRISGVSVAAPPPQLLGNYLQRGNSDAEIAWLNHQAENPRTTAFVVSTDMLAYGGLIASRTPNAAYADAEFRLRELDHLRARRPNAWIGAFGTVMRLAPTGVPADTAFFASYPTWSYLQDYAMLHDPPLPSEMARAKHLQALIGVQTLNAYLSARARDLAIDRILLRKTATDIIDRLVLGQDDAGPVGLHVREVQLLQSELFAAGLQQRASIEPGADELGMALVAHALARSARWIPRIAVRYSVANGASYQDPIEYAPVSTAIGALIGVCGGIAVEDAPDIVLYVRVANTPPEADDAFTQAMAADVAAKRSVALADISFLKSEHDQAAFARAVLASGLASKLDAYSSWNTNANTVGTALAEAIAAGAGRRLHSYDALAHREFTFQRFVDDYAFHDFVRPNLNAVLAAQGITDHTLLAAGVAPSIEQRDRALLWGYAAAILAQLYPSYHIAAMSIGLPWNRTFETSIQVGLAPNL